MCASGCGHSHVEEVRLCERCGVGRLPNKRRRLCDACRCTCVKCGKPKQRGKYATCLACWYEPRRAPCALCGGPKGPGKRHKFCKKCAVRRCRVCGVEIPRGCHRAFCKDPDCEAFRRDFSRTRRRARKVKQRKPCRGCGKVKARGQGLAYCVTCQKARSRPRVCKRCNANPILAKYARLCVACRAEANVRARERDREWQRNYYRLHGRDWGARKPAAPACGPSFLPIEPLVPFLLRELAARQVGFRQLATITGVSDKTLREWCNGKRRVGGVRAIDSALQSLDLMWWEVWEMPVDRIGRGSAREVLAHVARVEGCVGAVEAFGSCEQLVAA